RQQSPNRVAIEVLDAHLLKPAGLHDASDPGRVIAVALVDLHLEHRLGVASVNADDRQAKLLELGPQPCGRWSCLKANPPHFPCIRSHKRSDSRPDQNRPLLLAQPIPPGSPHKSTSVSTTHPVQRSAPLSLSIFVRPHEAGRYCLGELIP